MAVMGPSTGTGAYALKYALVGNSLCGTGAADIDAVRVPGTASISEVGHSASSFDWELKKNNHMLRRHKLLCHSACTTTLSHWLYYFDSVM